MKSNFIDGSWHDGESARPNINPSDTSDVIDEYAQASAADTADAIAAAKNAAPAWANANLQARFDSLERIGAELFQRRDELGTLLSREEGKTLSEGIAEVSRASSIFKFFAGQVLRQGGESIPSVRSGIDVDISREPLGVVGIITPWNFPIAIPAWKIAPALAYGNCVVFKPADLVPGSAWALAEIISRSGLPAGVFNLTMGRGAVVGQTILDSTAIDAITFTGSVATGRRVASAAIQRFVKIQLEMGGKNPLVILDDADIEVALNCAINGSYFSTGQRCTASSRLIVGKGIYAAFAVELSRRLKQLRVGHALTLGTDIGPVVDPEQLRQDLDYVAIGIGEGARLVCGGEPVKRATEGYFLTPALFTDADNSMRIAREEIFGPVACMIPADDFEHALALANDSEFGLSAGICTTSLKHAMQFKRRMKAGMVMINAPTAGVDYHVPFGGSKGSSYGPREQGTYAAEFFSTTKTTYIAAN